jgi:hypothetical protein
LRFLLHDLIGQFREDPQSAGDQAQPGQQREVVPHQPFESIKPLREAIHAQ